MDGGEKGQSREEIIEGLEIFSDAFFLRPFTGMLNLVE